MGDQLACLAQRQPEAQSQGHGIKAHLELLDELFTSDAFAARGLREVGTHLALVDSVHGPELLLLEQPHLELSGALAPAAVLAGRIGSLEGRAVRAAA